MAEKIPTPSYGVDMSISSYEKEVVAWEMITKVARDKRGIMLALNLEGELKNRVLENVSADSLHKETGVKDLLQYIKDTFGKDELTDSNECYRDFRDYKRRPGQSINDYISEFSSRVNRLSNKGVNINNEILAFEIIQRAVLTAVEEKLVFTGLDFSKKDDMYDDAKTSLKKFIRGTTLDDNKSTFAVNETNYDIEYNNVDRTTNFYQRNRGRNFRGQRGQRRPNYINRSNGNNVQLYQNDQRGNHTQNYRGRNLGEQNSRFNPRNRFGQTMLCFGCGSNRHFVRFCPRKGNSFVTVYEDEENNMALSPSKENPVLMLDSKVKTLSLEARGCAVIDTACASTVAGENWYEDFVSNHLPKEERKNIKKREGKKTFRFGAGPPVKSKAEVVLPVCIAGTKVSLVVDIVKNDVPLLLSIASIKKADGVIFTNKSVISLFGKEIQCMESSTGHWMMPLVREIQVSEVCAVDIFTLNVGELEQTLLKLHAQFGHPAKQKLTYLLKNANMWNDRCENLLEKIQSNCKICKQFPRTPARPVVALPMAREFNEAVCVDLKLWKGKWILHMVDMHSRYIQSVWVPRKSSRDILDAIIESWCGVFGMMKIMLSDNGGEFTSEEIREVTSFLNIKKYTTAAESPWQNGLCERIHAITDQILSKLFEEYPNVKLQTLLKWANMAKNSLQMNNGFSPHQLVFGNNPNLPNLINAKPPALEATTKSEIFAKHLNLMQLARQAYIKAESSERIKRALRYNIRTVQDTFKPGEYVYYKREDSEKWLGPGKVMFQDGKIVFIRHGSVYVKASVNRIIKENVSNQEIETQNPQKEDQTRNFVNAGPNPLPAQNIRKSDRLKGKENISYAEEVEVYVTIIPKEEQNSPECVKAKIAELEKLKEYGVYQELEDVGYNTLSTRWVMTMKEGEPRARLVVRGFEEEEMIQKDSPTVSKSAMRLLFVIATSYNWKIKTTDIKSAFLQGKELDRIVYVKPPKEARNKERKIVWKLRKCLYGLSDASRHFYMAVREILIKCKCKQSSVEPSLFYLLDETKKIRGILVSHIDDFLHGGDEYFETNVINPLIERFTAGKVTEESFTYVGFQIIQNRKGIIMNQNQYIDSLNDGSENTPKRDKNSILTDKEQSEYRGLIGSINWCVRNSRPDLAFEITELSMKMREATVGDWKRAVKCIKKLKARTYSVYYPRIEDLRDIKLQVYSDASFANLNDKVSSAMGFVIFITYKDRTCPLGWKAGKVKRVVKSTLAAEALALSDGIGETIYLQQMINELLGFRPPIVAHVDSKGLVDQLNSTKLVSERMLRIDIGIIKELLEERRIETVKWCPTEEQLADVLTKRGADATKIMNALSQGKIEH